MASALTTEADAANLVEAVLNCFGPTMILNQDTHRSDGYSDRWAVLGPGLPPLPERLLLAHAQGRVLFIAGAGVSQPAGYPSFRKLTLDVYQTLDKRVFAALEKLPDPPDNTAERITGVLSANQAAEVDRFLSGDFDVVLGMLERRLDTNEHASSRVRQAIGAALRGNVPAVIHESLLRLANRGNATTIATTNFDLLFEEVNRRKRMGVQSYALGSNPRGAERAPGVWRRSAHPWHA